MKTKLAIAITSALALSACVDDYTLESEGDNFHSVGTVAVIGEAIEDEVLTATITDNDGFDEAGVTYTWYRDNAPATDITSKTYTLSATDVGHYYSVKVEYVDEAGYSEVAISEDTEEVRYIPVPLQGSATIEGDFFVTGVIGVVLDDGNKYGDYDVTYQWMADGEALGEPAVNTDGEKIKLTAAEEGAIITVRAVYKDNDGFDNDVTSSDSPAIEPKPVNSYVEKIAEITDLLDDEAGQLRIKLTDTSTGNIDDPDDTIQFLEQGRLSVRFQKDLVVNDAGESKDAYIAIYGSSTSTDYAIVDLKINDAGTYFIRSWDDTGAKSDIALPDVPARAVDDWVDVDITWDASAADTSVGPTVIVYINDVQAWTGTSTSEHLAEMQGGVQAIQFKVADSGNVIPDGSLRVDDIKVYSDIAGTDAALVFEDNFEAEEYTVGGSLNKDDVDAVGEYNNNSFGAVVEEVTIVIPDEPTDGGGDTDANLLALKIIDESTSKEGQTVFKSSAAIEKGKITMSFYKEKDSEGSDGKQKDAYIGVYSKGGSNKNALIDLRLHGVYPDDGGLPEDGKTVVDYGTMEQRTTDAGAGSGLEKQDPVTVLKATDDSIVGVDDNYNQGIHYNVGEWQDIEITWDCSIDEACDMTVSLADEGEDLQLVASFKSVADYAYNSLAATYDYSYLNDGFEKVQIRFGDGSRTIMGKQFQVDDIKIYSYDTGSEVLDVDEDFESESAGDIPAAADPANTRFSEVASRRL